METRRLENLLEACGELLVQDTQERCKEQAIVAAINLWLEPRQTQPGLALAPPTQSANANNKE